MNYIDTHAHLYDEVFDEDRTEVIARARAKGCAAILMPNIDANSLGPMIALSDEWKGYCLPMIGLHPTALPEDPQILLQHFERMLQVPQHPFIAIGEVGVDLYWDETRCEEQMQVFRRQAEWSIKYDLPLVIHMRKAQAEIVEVLSPLKSQLKGGIFHCFGGTEQEAEELLDFPNFYLGIGGVVTFKKSTLPEVLASTVPLERIVVETDAPYLAPTPYRGKRNEPAHIPLVLHRLAEIYQCSPNDIAQSTTQAAQSLFGLQ